MNLLLLFSLSCLAGESLKDLFEVAKNRSIDNKIYESRVIQNESNERIAKGAVYPKVKAIAGYNQLDVSGLKAGTKSYDESLRLNLAQTLFDGGEAFHILDSLQNVTLSTKLKKEERELLLFQNLATIYYTIGSTIQDMKNLESSIAQAKDRFNELEKRRAIGRSRESEVINAKAQLVTLQAQLEGDRGELKGLYESLYEFTEKYHTDSLQFPNQGPKIKDLDYYLASLQSRPDVLATEYAMKGSEDSIASKKAAQFGDLALGGNYYLHRTGTLEKSDWDVGLTYTLPLYEGGTINESINQALEKKREEALVRENLLNTSRAEIKRLFEEFNSLTSEVKLLEEAYQQNSKNYEVQQKEYRYSLVTNLDVIQALNSMVESKRNLDRTIYEAKLLKIKLETKAGIINPLENE